jgi:hypothetical protein
MLKELGLVGNGPPQSSGQGNRKLAFGKAAELIHWEEEDVVLANDPLSPEGCAGYLANNAQ